MTAHFECHVYRSDLLYDHSGLNDPAALGVGAVVATVWDPSGDPVQVYTNIVIKLKETHTVSSMVSRPNKYVVIPDGKGGYKRYCIAQKVVNVTVNGVTVAVDLSWGVDQGPPPN